MQPHVPFMIDASHLRPHGLAAYLAGWNQSKSFIATSLQHAVGKLYANYSPYMSAYSTGRTRLVFGHMGSSTNRKTVQYCIAETGIGTFTQTDNGCDNAQQFCMHSRWVLPPAVALPQQSDHYSQHVCYNAILLADERPNMLQQVSLQAGS